MQRDEAKQHLELCRPGNDSDRQDPALAEAFALLESDAELRAWFDAQQETDARISASLNALEAPADLKTSILAGMRLHRAQAVFDADSHADLHPSEAGFPALDFPAHPAKERPIPIPRPRSKAWWQSPWAGIAALIAIAMVVVNLPMREPAAPAAANDPTSTTLAGLPPVIEFLSQEIDGLKLRGFDKRSNQVESLKAYLASTQSPAPKSIPDGLNKMATIGCVTFDYGGAKLSMICFKNGDVYHLATADRATFPDALPLEPEFFETKGKAFRIWVDGEQVKILTVHGTKKNIPEII